MMELDMRKPGKSGGWKPYLLLAGVAFVQFASLSGVQAAGFPEKSVRFIVPVAAGGVLDATARVVANKLSERWQQQVVVEAKPGASGMIGIEAAVRSPADGYTVLFGSTSQIQASVFLPNGRYDVFRDLMPISQVAGSSVVLTVKGDGFPDLKTMLASATAAKPLTYGSVGIGSSLHVYGATLAKSANVNMVHVPFKGESMEITQVMGGHLDMAITSISAAAELMRSGGLRGLAVVGSQRSPLFPDIPTFVELGYPKLDILGYFGVFVPAGTPKPIVDKLAADVIEVSRRDDVKKTLIDLGLVPVGSTPEEFDKTVRNGIESWRQLYKENEISLNP